ncbi:DUF2637 domain-containing protein [Streptomyces sp. NPDC057456]|uniref:DUF2637 domain-containing protein n=1 Tax=Streptomyces sp. NPDC057456 TaxID=3346139 RepID=UPI0036C04F9E
MNLNPTRALAIAAGLVIIALTAAAFWLSYAHLAEVALAHGMRGKEVRAWAWPACLDLFIMAGELMWLRAAMLHRVDWWAICLTAAGSGGSIALNVAGVGGQAELLDYVVAAVPPTAALLAFGALMRQVHQALTGRDEVADEVAAVRGDIATVATLPKGVANDRGPTGTFVEDGLSSTTVVQSTTVAEPAPLVIPAATVPSFTPTWDVYKAVDIPRKMTAAVPAEQARQVVTEVVALTPADLRREARKLNSQAVRSTRRPVTIRALQDELGLSRRDATDLRREVVGDRS